MPSPPPADGAARHAWCRAVFQDHDLGQPPDFTGLADVDLRLAAARTWPAASRWVDQGPRSRTNEREHLAYEVVREVAEDVAFDHRVDTGEVRAWIFTLDVHGSWWQRWAPGVVLCSFTAAEDPHTARVVLWDAFTRACDPGMGSDRDRRAVVLLCR